MIAAAAHWHWIEGETSGYDLDVVPNLRLVPAATPRKGKAKGRR
jgi:hypothetical protein